MDRANFVEPSGGGREDEAQVRAALLERRRYHREYMRRRRADARFEAHEKAGRDRRRLARKLAATSSDAPGDTANHDGSVCGLCGQRSATDEIVRLRIVDDSPSGYVEVRVPYCGQC